MDGKSLKCMLLIGLCALYSCSSQVYHLVNTNKNWAEAQMYCREMYTDLATINSTEDMALVNNLLNNGAEEFWIGLHSSSNEWLWSLEKEGFYGDGQADFRLWGGEPGSPYDHFHCAEIYYMWGWDMYDCDEEQPFVCYNGLSNVQPIERKLVKITLSTSASSLDLEESQDAILQQLRSKLPEHGLGDLKLRWIKQSDGKTFHLKKKDKK